MKEKWEAAQKLFELNDTWKVTFTKKDGSERVMVCTRKLEKIPVENHPKGNKEINYEVMPVWDLESGGWRSFKIDSILNMEMI